MKKDLDNIQKRILAACLKFEAKAAVNVMSHKGRMLLVVDIGISTTEVEKCGYLDFNNCWVQGLITNGLLFKKNSTPVQSGDAFWLTDEGVELARQFAEQMNLNNDFVSACAEQEHKATNEGNVSERNRNVL